MTKKSLFLTLLLLVCAAFNARAVTFGNELLKYKVLYKWGLVQKQAGHATLTFSDRGDHYKSILYASSEPWADHFYSVRDTLISTMSRVDLAPMKYERIANEGGRYSHDIIEITRAHNTFVGQSTRYRRKKGEKQTTKASTTLTAEGMTVDMLSVFYHLRSIDFAHEKPGYTKTLNIFSGKRKEKLTIRYAGMETIELEGRKYPTYHVTFKFTTEGSKKSSDDIDTWIWANKSNIPLKLEGKLKIGKIRCIYTGGSVPLK